MIKYRCFLLGREGEVRATEEIDAYNKEDALALARAILGHRGHHAGFELWLDAKCVHLEPVRSEPHARGDAIAPASI